MTSSLFLRCNFVFIFMEEGVSYCFTHESFSLMQKCLPGNSNVVLKFEKKIKQGNEIWNMRGV